MNVEMTPHRTRDESGQYSDDQERLEKAGHELAMALRRAYLTMHRATNACFANFKISADSFTVLTVLAEKGPMTQQDIVHRISSDSNTVSAMIARLEQRNLVSRKTDSRDGRIRMVRLTAQGRKLQRQLWQASRDIRCELVRRIDPGDLSCCVASLNLIASAIDHTTT